jgi:hypothetical protein
MMVLAWVGSQGRHVNVVKVRGGGGGGGAVSNLPACLSQRTRTVTRVTFAACVVRCLGVLCLCATRGHVFLQNGSQLRDLLVVHAVGHAVKSRRLVQKHNGRIRSAVAAARVKKIENAVERTAAAAVPLTATASKRQRKLEKQRLAAAKEALFTGDGEWEGV